MTTEAHRRTSQGHLPPMHSETKLSGTVNDSALHSPGPPNSSSTDEFYNSIPSPILRLLVLLARPIYYLRRTVEVLTWKSSSPVESWLALGGWWALCFGARATWKAFLPLIFVPLVVPLSPYWSSIGTDIRPSTMEGVTPSTTQSVLMTLSHLHALNAMLPPTTVDPVHISWLKSWKDMERHRLIRGGISIWVMWIGLNLALGGRATLALVGSACILASSPAIKSMYTVLGQSLLLRRTAALVFLLVFGSPPVTSTGIGSSAEGITGSGTWVPIKSWLQGKWRTSRRPSFAFRLRPEDVAALRKDETDLVVQTTQEDLKIETSSASAPLYFRFELQENQRWWMGLDWTSALLPQERPSWCDAYLNPSSPPSGFVLPSDSTMFLPEPKKGDPNGRTKRISRWRWLDEDWSVIKRLGTSGATHLPASVGANPTSGTHHARSSSISAGDAVAPNSGSTEEPKKGLAEQAFVKGLERLKARTMTGSSGPPASPSSRRPISGDYGEGASSAGGHDKLAGRASFDSDRRKSSAASDLAGPLGAHASGASGLGQGVTPSPLGAGSASNASGSLSLLADLDVGTDGDGWSYGDNKWENMGPRGGLGRYTRRRRWQRLAVCTEEVIYIPGSSSTALQSSSSEDKLLDNADSSSQAEDSNSKPSPLLPPLGYSVGLAGATASPATVPTTVLAGKAKDEAELSSSIRRDSRTGERDQALRQRLKSAMANVGS